MSGMLEAIWVKRAHRGRMDSADAVWYPDWRGGAFAEILEDAELKVGMPVAWEARID